jgi:hypothetical protein
MAIAGLTFSKSTPAPKNLTTQSFQQKPVNITQAVNSGGLKVNSGSIPTSNVLGTSTSNMQNGGWYNGQQYWAPGQAPQSNSPILESAPAEPSFDETPFNDIISSLNSLGGVFRDDYGTAEKGILQRSQSQLSDLQLQNTQANQGLDQYQTSAVQDTDQNVNQQRRALAEIQQGLQARYGGTTGTGAFVSELAGRETLGNIGKFKQTLANEFSKVNQLRVNLFQTYEKNKLDISNQTEQLIAQAKSELNKQLANLEIQKGQVNADKSARKTQAIQFYQSQVQEINARNTQYLRQLDEQKNKIQNSLQSATYKLTYNAMQKALGFYEKAALAGALTPSGIQAAEQAYGMAGGSLQIPPNEINPDEDEEEVDYSADSTWN